MKERPTTVYLILPARRLATHSTWLRLMITSMVQPLMKDVRKAKVPVLFMLDEYFALAKGGFPVIEDNMAMFRGYGIKLWTVFQDLSQAHSFAPQDLVTADYLSKRTGQTGRNVLGWSQQSEAGVQGSSGNITLSQTAMPLMLPQDVRNMEAGFFVMFSHKAKGTIPGYAPYPNLLSFPGMDAINALDLGALQPGILG
jgi:type IV secretion system protein VirD4